MTGSPLIALPPSPASPAGSVVAADGWWPDIDCNAARDALRLGEIITQPRLQAAIEGAILTITTDLGWWQAQLVAGNAGTNPSPWPGGVARTPSLPCATLADVTTQQLLALRAPRAESVAQSGYLYEYGWDAGRYEGGCGDGWGAFPDGHPRRWLYTPVQAAQLAASLNTQPRLSLLYTRAVRMAAACELVQEYRDFGATKHADIRAEALTDPAADYRRMASEAIADMLGKTRITSVLL